MQSYDLVYSVSDLHLGGRIGRVPGSMEVLPTQAMGSAKRLAQWIKHITPSSPPLSGEIGLVINGDFIDFLAENPTQYLDFSAPARHVRRVAADPSFAQVFDALKRFVAAPGTRLVVVIGNHDVEFLHPESQQALLDVLGFPSTKKFEFALDGTGYRCSVGGRAVFFTHGNEHDSFNLLDHRALRRLLRRAKRGESLRQAEIREATNAGTRLVVDVMNVIKQELPFVDLLKPEIEAVIPLLLNLPRERVPLPDLGRAIEIARRRSSDARRMSDGLLGDDVLDAPQSDSVRLSAGWSSERWDSVESRYQHGATAVDIARAEGAGTLSISSALVGSIGAKLSSDGLREYLKTLMLGAGQTTFLYNDPNDEQFIALDREVDPSVDFIFAGHTHLARLVKRRNGEGFYCNTGTWMRLLRLSPALLADDKAWMSAREALLQGDVAKIDDWRWSDAPQDVSARDRSLLLDRCSIAKVERSSNGTIVRASLLIVDAEGREQRDYDVGLDPAELSAK
jgi:hypothetical protein